MSLRTTRMERKGNTMVPLELELFLRIAENLYNREMVQSYLQLLVRLGFRVITQDEDEVYQQAVPEVSLLAQQGVEAYLEQRQISLGLIAYYLGDLTIEIWFTLKPQEGVIYFMVEQEHFNGSDEGRAAYIALLGMFKETYTFWHPFYGYQLFNGGDKEGVQPEREALLATHDIHHLYIINFLSPEIVATLGRGRLLNAPAWRCELLDDGGVLLIPDNMTDITAPFSLKRVADILGLQTPQDPGEEWFEDIHDDPGL